MSLKTSCFSSKVVDFQIVNEPQNLAFASEMIDFEEGFLAPSRQVHTYVFGWPCRVADSLFRPHPQQRARAKRGRVVEDEVEKANRRPDRPDTTRHDTPHSLFEN